ncbi:hypothetical protein BDP27DRAFT_1366503 [Rhodocollybia butyracea]|uniref:Uncharacterized protein n=1 Tax=Rhodocollybia butyracea TaxID=206335 RepID=A0A9P5PMI7_9AGAR|nr:hypothetical protein BDP27DRAFT_1366503 [Rhodocollybia butyracea]
MPALQNDNRVWMDAEDREEILDDEDVELEDVFLAKEDLGTPALPYLLALSRSRLPLLLSTQALVPNLRKKNLAKRVRECAKRSAAAQARKSTSDLKSCAMKHAQSATPVSLSDFDASSLPVSSTGWTGVRSLSQLSSGLQRIWRNLSVLTQTGLKLLNWDGEACIVLVDASDRIMAVLGGVPPGSKGPEWQSVLQGLNAALARCSEGSTFTSKETSHPRGGFTARATGIGYGGGRQVPGNVKISGEANQAKMQKLMLDSNMLRVVGFSNSIKRTASTKRRSPIISLGILAFVLHPPAQSLQLPRSTILFPSVLIIHSNIPVSSRETRYSIIQYSAGAFSVGGTMAGARIRPGFPRLLLSKGSRGNASGDLVAGDWQGKKRTEAGLDELSELSDDEVDLPVLKRTRYR